MNQSIDEENLNRHPYPAPWYAWLTVFVFFIAYIFSFIDRMILSLLVEPMKRDLVLTDTQFSLLQGFAFALLYTFAGLPLGRLLDRTKRVRVAAYGVGFWSLMTALCGMVGNFWQLFLARVGVGVGEATLSPAAYSIFADSFEPRRLGLVLGIYNVGASIGAGLAMIIGGYVVHAVTTMDQVVLPLIGEIHAWQLTFLIVGPPGIIVALFVARLREPERQGIAKGTELASIPVKEVLAFAKRHRRSLTLHHLGIGLTSMSAFGALSWTPALLTRVHQWPSDKIGLWLGVAIIIGGVLGFIGGGWLGDKFSQSDGIRGRLRVGVLVALTGVPAALIFSWQPNPYVTVALVGVIYMCAAGALPAAVAVLNELAPNQMRGQLAALFIFSVNIIGLGFGATLVALASDYIFTGDTGLRYALLLTTPIGYVLSAICFRLSYGAFERSFKSV